MSDKKKSSGSASFVSNAAKFSVAANYVPDQPVVPYVHIEIGDLSITDPPYDDNGNQMGSGNLVTDFKITRNSNDGSDNTQTSDTNVQGGDHVTFTVVDETAVLIESKLEELNSLMSTSITKKDIKEAKKLGGAEAESAAKSKADGKSTDSKGNIKVQYGYDGPTGAKSDLVQYVVTGVTPQFTSYGMKLTVEADSIEIVTAQNRTNKVYIVSPSDAVKQIANSNGYKVGLIVDTKQKYTGSGDKKEIKKYRQNGLGDFEFISKVLLPDAEAKDGTPGNYVFWTDQDHSGNIILNFAPKGAQLGTSQNMGEISKVFTFKWGSVSDTTVRSFTPNYEPLSVKNMFSPQESDTKAIDSSTIEKFTNALFNMSYDLQDNPWYNSLKSNGSLNPAYKIQVGGSSYTYSDLQSIAASQWYYNMGRGYTAELVVVGDPTLKPQTLISVIVMSPNGLPHHSSGVYRITAIEDEISGGHYDSTLSLERNTLTATMDSDGNLQLSVGASGTEVEDSDSSGTADDTTVAGTNSSAGGSADGKVDSKTLSAFVKKWTGKKMGKGQCYSASSQWVLNLIGKSLGSGVGGTWLEQVPGQDKVAAKNIYAAFKWPEHWGYQKNPVKSDLREGDILCIDSAKLWGGSHPYGHTAIVMSVLGDNVTVFEQNAPNQYGEVHHYSWSTQYGKKGCLVATVHVDASKLN